MAGSDAAGVAWKRTLRGGAGTRAPLRVCGVSFTPTSGASVKTHFSGIEERHTNPQPFQRLLKAGFPTLAKVPAFKKQIIYLFSSNHIIWATRSILCLVIP